MKFNNVYICVTSIWYHGDTMSTTITVRLNGEPEKILDEMVKKGYSASKNEAIRTSLVFYALQLGLISPSEIHKNIKSLVKSSGIRYSENEVKKQLKAIRK